MKQVATLLVAGAVLAVPQAAAKTGPPSQLLGFVSNGHTLSVAKLGALTLKPISRAAPTGTSDASFVAVVAGGGRAAFSLSSAALRFLDFQRMRWEFRIAYPGRPVASLWNSADRLVTVSATGEVIVVNPVKRRLGTIRPLRGTVSTVATTSDHILAVIAPLDGIGAARLAVIDDRGRVRTTTLPEIRAGSEMLDNGALFRYQFPAVAVNAAGTQAVVIGADGTVADVTLAGLATSTHRLLSRTLASVRKNANGSSRTAQWIGANTVALTGSDASFDGVPPTGTQRSTPAGLTLIDTRDWSTRKLDSDTSGIAPSGFGPGCILCSGVLVAYGSNGLTGYESDGAVRFRMFAGKQVRPIVAASYAYVGAVGDGTHYTIVDTATGGVVTSVVTSVPTYLAPFPYY